MLFFTNLTWNSFTSQNSKTHALFRQHFVRLRYDLLSRSIFQFSLQFKFKVDRLQIIVVAKKYIYVSQLSISRMPKMRAILQLVSAPLNPIPIAEYFKRKEPPTVWAQSRTTHISEENKQSKTKRLLNERNVHAT